MSQIAARVEALVENRRVLSSGVLVIQSDQKIRLQIFLDEQNIEIDKALIEIGFQDADNNEAPNVSWGVIQGDPEYGRVTLVNWNLSHVSTRDPLHVYSFKSLLQNAERSVFLALAVSAVPARSRGGRIVHYTLLTDAP